MRKIFLYLLRPSTNSLERRCRLVDNDLLCLGRLWRRRQREKSSMFDLLALLL